MINELDQETDFLIEMFGMIQSIPVGHFLHQVNSEFWLQGKSFSCNSTPRQMEIELFYNIIHYFF